MKTNGNRVNLMVLIVSMPVGGIENLIASVIKRLKPEKYDITICCIRELGTLGEELNGLGIRTVSLGLMKSNRFSFNIPLQISKILEKYNIHILWTNQYVANLYGRMGAFLSNTPVVISNFQALYDNPKIHRRIFNHILSYKTDRMIAASHTVALDIKRYDRVNSNKIKVIHNGIDPSFFDTPFSKMECRKRFNLPEDDVIIGTSGRLSKEKNQKDIILALQNLPDNMTGLIIGDGPLRQNLERMADGRIYFIGQLKHDLVPLALKAMDIFCFPSLWEGFGIALAEAMATGLPIAASDIPTHREVLDDAGVFFLPGNIKTLTETLNVLINDPSLREKLGEKARERAKLFSIENIVRAYEQLFGDMLKKKNVYDAI